MIVDKVIKLKCLDCDWETQVCDEASAEHCAADHLHRYVEKPLNHTIEATPAIHYFMGPEFGHD